MLPQNTVFSSQQQSILEQFFHRHLAHFEPVSSLPRKSKYLFINNTYTGMDSANQESQTSSLVTYGMIQANRGKLHRAVKLYQKAINNEEKTSFSKLALIELANIQYEWNELTASKRHLEMGLQADSPGEEKDILSRACCLLVRHKSVRGAGPKSMALLLEAHNILKINAISQFSLAQFAYTAIKTAYQQKDLFTAARWAQQLPAQTYDLHTNLLNGISLCYLMLGQNERRTALRRLQYLCHACRNSGLTHYLVEIRCLQALCSTQAAKSLTYLKEALSIAQPEGYLRTLTDIGNPLARLLKKITSPELQAYAGKLIKTIESEQSRGKDLDLNDLKTQMPARITLSHRELDVLQLMAKGFTNQVISETLHISLGTVKTHVHNILYKLKAKNRINAILLYRQLDVPKP